MYKKLLIIFCIILLVGTVSSRVWTPVGDIDLKDFYSVLNAKNYTGERANFTGNVSIGDELNVENNVTSGNWFNGLFNWTTLTDWLSFDGATLSFNQTKADDRFWNDGGDNVTGIYNIDGSINATNYTGTRANFTGNVEVGNNLTMGENIFLEDGILYLDSERKHIFKVGCTEVIDGIAPESFCLWHQEVHDAGTIADMLIEGMNLTNLRLIRASTVGKNNSGSVLGNSQFIIRNDICQLSGFNNGTACDMDNVTNIFRHYARLAIGPFMNADTKGEGASLFIEGKLDIMNGMRILNGFLGFGKFTWVGTGGTADFINTSLHPQTEVTFESGFAVGESRIVLNAPFLGVISPFKNLDVSPFVWFIDTSSLCKDDSCAHVDGSSGASDVTMTTNTSTLNLNETFLSFHYSLVSLIGANNFRVETNNFTGSGWEIQFTDAGTEVVLFESIELGSDYWNVSTIGVRFICDVSQPLRSCFVDNVILNGTQTLSTNENVTGIFSQICFGTGQMDSEGICDRGIYYDPSEDKTFIAGPFNVTNGGGGGSGISGTANRILKATGDGTTAGNSNLNDDGSVIDSDVSIRVDGDVNSTGFFRGLFNWTVLTNWFSFDGATLSFNETKLNETISNEGLRLGFNSTFNESYAGSLNNASYLTTQNDTYDQEIQDRINNDTSIRNDFVSADNGNRTEIETLIDSVNTTANINALGYNITSELENQFTQIIGGANPNGTWNWNGGFAEGGASISGGDIFAQALYVFNITGVDVNTLNINGSILPQEGFDDTFNIGNITRRWKSVSIGTGDSSFAGKVGIGTDSPDVKLEISDAGGAEISLFRDDSIISNGEVLGTIRFGGLDSSRRTSAFIDAIVGTAGYGGSTNDAPTTIRFFTQDETGSDTLGNPRMVINDIGQVGIGTASPDTKLEVANGASFNPTTNVLGAIKLGGNFGGGLIFEDTGYAGIWVVDSGDTLAFSTQGTASGFSNTRGEMVLRAGNVGIGTPSPDGKLNVVDTGDNEITFDSFSTVDSNSVELQLRKSATNTIGTLTPVVDGENLGEIKFFGVRVNGEIYRQSAEIGVIADVDGGDANRVGGHIIFKTEEPGTTLREVMRIQSDGKVGIGTDSPKGVLHISDTGSDQLLIENPNADSGKRIFRLSVGTTGSLNIQLMNDTGDFDKQLFSFGSDGLVTLAGKSNFVGDSINNDNTVDFTFQSSPNNGLDGGVLITGFQPRFIMNDRSGSADWFDWRVNNDILILGRGDNTDLHTRIVDNIIVVDEDGNVGIGTDSPNHKLELTDTGDFQIHLEGASNSYNAITFRETTAINQIFGIGMDGDESFRIRSGNIDFGLATDLIVIDFQGDTAFTGNIGGASFASGKEFTVCGEESGSLTINAFEYSMGNGDDPTAGFWTPADGKLTWMTISCLSCSGIDSTVEVSLDTTGTDCKTDIDQTGAITKGGSDICSDTFTAGQIIRGHTIDNNGVCQGCVMCIGGQFD